MRPAVITRSNQSWWLLAEGGKQAVEASRCACSSLVHTPPLVAGGRVFVLARPTARCRPFDAAKPARQLWTSTAPGRAPGAAPARRADGRGQHAGGRPVRPPGGPRIRMTGRRASGRLRWPSPRGTNDVERLVDLVGPASAASVTCRVRARLPGGRGLRGYAKCIGRTAWSQTVQGSRWELTADGRVPCLVRREQRHSCRPGICADGTQACGRSISFQHRKPVCTAGAGALPWCLADDYGAWCTWCPSTDGLAPGTD